MAIHDFSSAALSQPNPPRPRHDSDPSISAAGPVLDIIDIRRDFEEIDILDGIHKGLRAEPGVEKTLPTLLLYDELGLQWFEKITYLEEYYPTNAEIEVLTQYATSIARRIKPNSIILELGSGNLRKVNILLQALEKAQKPVHYYALDLNLDELKRTLGDIHPGTYKHVQCSALHGTYDDGLLWLQSPSNQSLPKVVLSLGSSIGNFTRPDASAFLDSFCNVLQPGDTMLIGLDACKDASKVYHAYNDRDGVTREFYRNGLDHANKLLGHKQGFNLQEWDIIGEYDEVHGRHHCLIAPNKDVVVDGVKIPKGERIRFEESYKYSELQKQALWQATGFVEGVEWRNAAGFYGIHMISKPQVFYSARPELYAPRPVPTLAEWEQLWGTWDAVTRQMIPREELLSKPIKLRNQCIFYVGHIPTFLDIQLCRGLEQSPTDPYYNQIFERGIDPDVENPEQCHAHSETPSDWPAVDEIFNFQEKVRNRVRKTYTSSDEDSTTPLRRALWIGFEHEALHLETLLYMLTQSETTLPPPGTVAPDWEALAEQSRRAAVPNEWVTLPENDITLGLEDTVASGDQSQFFGWDVEVPKRTSHVRSFQAKARPITNGEFAEYLKESGSTKAPASWCSSSPSGTAHIEDKFVRTVYGNVPLRLALSWPVIASYDELTGCAQWMGGRIPTLEEVRSIYSYVDQNTREASKLLSKTIPAVNGHLINEGVQETPPTNGHTNGSSSNSAAAGAISHHVHAAFVNLDGANVGFSRWHPTSVVENGTRLSGQGDFGGAWEWTSSPLTAHPGYKPMPEYPAYSSDFFDGKHNVVLGGSWATHPRIAGRKSFVNWYQRNYPFVWAGARVVRDI